MALLEVNDLRTHFFTREGTVRAVDGISFAVEKGQTLGIVGESGCGKSVTALSIMGLIPKPPAKIVTGEVLFEGRDLTKLSERQLEDVRGQVLTLKENDYVRAAKAVGARWYRILTRHLLPNTLGVLIIAIFLELPAVILGEAFLSFIGLGISPPDASWGAMAQEGRTTYRTHPIEIVVPSIAIATLVLCANFIADGLRDALDPRTRES